MTQSATTTVKPDLSRLSTEEIEAKIAEIKAQHRQLVKIFPGSQFVPNGAQERFLKMIDEGVRLREHRTFVAPWGRGSEKTSCEPNII